MSTLICQNLSSRDGLVLLSCLAMVPLLLTLL